MRNLHKSAIAGWKFHQEHFLNMYTTTMRVYNHVDSERVKREIEKLNQLQAKMG